MGMSRTLNQLNIRSAELISGALVGPVAVAFIRAGSRVVEVLSQVTYMPFQQISMPILTKVTHDRNALHDTALARALYGDPFLLVLDEPNSNLDAAGEAALIEAVRAAKERGAIVVIVGHRPSVFAHADHILLMGDGQMRQMGERDEMLQRLNLQPSPAAAAPVPMAAQS